MNSKKTLLPLKPSLLFGNSFSNLQSKLNNIVKKKGVVGKGSTRWKEVKFGVTYKAIKILPKETTKKEKKEKYKIKTIEKEAFSAWFKMQNHLKYSCKQIERKVLCILYGKR